MTADTLADLTVAEALRRLPGAARVFVTRGMSCVGCPFAPFETIAEVARIYHVDPAALAAALLQAPPAASAEPKGLHS